MDSKSKERGSNFSNNELEILKRLIDDNKHILLCKKTDAISQGLKEKTWNDIHMQFNASSSRHRSVKQLKYKFDNMKKSARKEASKERQERRRTGGGQVPGMSTSDHSEKDWMRSLMVLSADGLESTYDDDTLPENVELTGDVGTLTPAAQVNIDELINLNQVMTPSVKQNIEYIENSQGVLLLSDDVIVTQPSHTPNSSSQSKAENPNTDVVIASGEMENVANDTGAPGCLLRQPVSLPLKCRKRYFDTTPVSVRKSIKMLSDEKLQCTKEKERILEDANRRAEADHGQKMRHAQELHDQMLQHNQERHEKEMALLELKIKIQEAQLKR
ncbi:hypothetical protein PYW07_006278 [Mythimna separata]|uniref:Regulatory protein zeste n=1 Tax=Mythimna separata TaxID=271217 RepID=A0AAD8DWE4_MYTSE|nr:hypothetical protein PYW07_006278 [Mythimna separata]